MHRLIAFIIINCQLSIVNCMTLWYNRPAQYWEEALPIGNGRLGAMISSAVETDTLQLNEDTFWSGSPYQNYNETCLPHLQEMRDEIAKGTKEGYIEAQKLALRHIVADDKKTGHGMAYESVGRILLDFGHKDCTNYRRWLDISTAMAGMSYDCQGITYERRYWASLIDKVIFVRLTAKKKDKYINPMKQKGILTPRLRMISPEKSDRVRVEAEEGNPSMYVFRSTLVKDSMEHVANKLECCTLVRMIEDDKGITIVISMGTNFGNYKALSTNSARAKASYYMDAFAEKVQTFPYGQYRTTYHEKALTDHIKKYRQQFDRVTLDLGCDSAQAKKDTETRIREFSSSYDPSLVALYFQYGRYLLISSSQPGTQPANLQGIWNPDGRQYPAWDSKYTTNINVEMNYWPAEVTNLAECHEPFFQMVRDVSESGRETARKMYGARGWVLHHNTDLWRATGAVDNNIAAIWPTGGAWFCSHLWEHWLYTGDRNFLKEYYPVMKGASQFFQDYLYRDPRSGYMVAGPSISPENHPGIASYVDERGKKQSCAVFSGITMDNQLIYDLLHNTSEAARILDIDKSFADSLDALRAQLPPMKIGRYGQLQEWLEDWDRETSGHRHISHLWGAYPGNLITPNSTPDLWRAVRTSLVGRGDASRGWSMGWKVCQWARQLDGDHALLLIKNQLKLKSPNATIKDQDGGTYANMFDAHPPFQIDGNFGCCAGIAEMLMQSHDGAIHLLPALPAEWSKEGTVTGLRARGGYEISKLQWKDGHVNHLIIKSLNGGNMVIRATDQLYTVTRTKVPVPYHPARHTTKIDLTKMSSAGEGLYSISTNAGQQIEIVTSKSQF